MRWLNSCLIFLILKMNRGETDMVALYALLIMKGLRTYDSVPGNLQPEVGEYLAAMELGQDGKPLQ